jgi:UDP-glucose 4-epimerase
VTSPRILVVGGAGFIGSHLVDLLAARGDVTVLDDLSVGREAHLASALATCRVQLVVGDARDLDAVTAAMNGVGAVVHLSANPEARWALRDPRLDLEQGTIATWTVLEGMRRAGVARLLFASSGTVYGPRDGVCREEDLGELPISLYGASKLAGEAMISAWVECFGLRASILRFGNVVGPRGTHGVALDLLRKLAASPGELEVLGDGRQSKPYLHVEDCARAMVRVLDDGPGPLDVFNLAPDGATPVAAIAAACVAASPYPGARLRFTGGAKGWPGDIPRSLMSGARIEEVLGLRLDRTSDEAVLDAVLALAREVFPDHLPDPAAVRTALEGACRP